MSIINYFDAFAIKLYVKDGKGKIENKTSGSAGFSQEEEGGADQVLTGVFAQSTEILGKG